MLDFWYDIEYIATTDWDSSEWGWLKYVSWIVMVITVLLCVCFAFDMNKGECSGFLDKFCLLLFKYYALLELFCPRNDLFQEMGNNYFVAIEGLVESIP